MSTCHVFSSKRPTAHLEELILLRLMMLALVKTSFKDHVTLRKPYNALSRRCMVTK